MGDTGGDILAVVTYINQRCGCRFTNKVNRIFELCCLLGIKSLTGFIKDQHGWTFYQGSGEHHQSLFSQ